MGDEKIVLLNNQCQPIGAAPKLSSHHADTPLHLAFSCYLFDPHGRLLITKRAAGKKVWPGVWSNSVCGHPRPGESLRDAVTRRLLFEIGISKISGLCEVLPDYRYRTPPFKGVIENEFCPVFTAVTRQTPRLNRDEATAYRWVGWEGLRREISENPDKFSYWLKDQLLLLDNKRVTGACR